MKTIYIDSEFKCHVSNNDTMIAIETDVFDNMCDTYIEGFRFVPFGKSWTRTDGTVFIGEMIAPWKPFSELDIVQREYEKQLLDTYIIEKKELNNSYNEGVNSI